MTRAALGSLLSVMAVMATAPSIHAATCRDTSGFAAAKSAVDAAVPCAGATRRGRYLKAAKRALRETTLRGTCRKEFLRRFIQQSTCGRSGVVVCCKVDQKGRNKSRVLSESRCVRKLKGTPCTTTGAENVGEGCTPEGTCVLPTRSAPTTTLPGSVVPTTVPVVTTTPTTSTTSTTVCTNPPCTLDFTNGATTGTCGQSRDAGSNVLRSFACGGLDIGGGGSTLPEGPTPDGSVIRFSLGCSEGICTIGPTSQYPASNSAEPDCTDTGCPFGAPLPIANPVVPMLSNCVVNTLSAAASGTLDLATGAALLNVPLSSEIFVTGNAAEPCPRCSATGSPASPGTGTCDGGGRAGQACTSTNSQGLTRDCPPDPSQSKGTIAVDLSPLATDPPIIKVANTGSGIPKFCNDQPDTQGGCFGSPTCQEIDENGAPAGPLTSGVPASVTLVSAFCIPTTGNVELDAAAGLPGPGAVSLTGTFMVK